MSATGMDWAEAERLWRRADREEDRLDIVERALAAWGASRRPGDGQGVLKSGRTK